MPLDPAAILTHWPAPLGTLTSPPGLLALTAPGAPCPFAQAPDDALRRAVRDLLREGGFSPSGRNKPCSEYIAGAAAKGAFPVINPAVDVGNLAALHGGVPTGVLDADLLVGPVSARVAPAGARYVFNRAGQELDLSGLLCLFDAEGPCASPVKDPMRTKTTEATTRTLTFVYGADAAPGRAAEVAAWILGWHAALGAEARAVALSDLP